MGSYRIGRLNWAVLQNPLVLGCTFLYLFHSVFRRLFSEPEIFNSYLNDLLCMPLVLAAAIFLQRNFILRKAGYQLTVYQILVVLIYWSVMFEVVIPRVVSRYTSDWFDVLAYAAGAALFYFFGNANNSNLVKQPAGNALLK